MSIFGAGAPADYLSDARSGRYRYLCTGWRRRNKSRDDDDSAKTGRD
jgi:hypothetical protein